MTWLIAMRPGKRRALNKVNQADVLLEKAKKLKASVRAKVAHPFWIIKRQFGFVKVRYRGLKKNTAQLFTLFALLSLWVVRGNLMGVGGCVRSETRKRPCKGRKRLQRRLETMKLAGITRKVPPSGN